MRLRPVQRDYVEVVFSRDLEKAPEVEASIWEGVGQTS